jgi:hypothetical protein
VYPVREPKSPSQSDKKSEKASRDTSQPAYSAPKLKSYGAAHLATQGTGGTMGDGMLGMTRR